MIEVPVFTVELFIILIAIFQVQLEKKVKKTVADCDTDKPLAVGDMCLLDVPKWANYWPLLGQVTRLFPPQEHKLEIIWWKSSLKGVCRPEMILKTNSANMSDWLEIVSRNQVWMFGFKLTAGNRFPKDVQRRIEQYDDS